MLVFIKETETGGKKKFFLKLHFKRVKSTQNYLKNKNKKKNPFKETFNLNFFNNIKILG